MNTTELLFSYRSSGCRGLKRVVFGKILRQIVNFSSEIQDPNFVCKSL